MKKQQREVYLELSGLVRATLCCWCRYGEFGGSSLCADGGWYECTHSLSDRPGFPECVEDGQDCWGFNPQWDLAVISDIIGIVLAKGWNQKGFNWGFQWNPDDEGDIKVAGIKETP